MVCHGGIFSKEGIKLSEIQKINRVREPPEEGLMCELLWSDPMDSDGRQPSKRGVGCMFGPDVAARFLDENNLSKSFNYNQIQLCWSEAMKLSQTDTSFKREAELLQYFLRQTTAIKWEIRVLL